jgi:hypothetical protein
MLELLKRLDMQLQMALDVVGACIILHNICILHTCTFDEVSLPKKCGFFHTISHGS